MRLFISDIDGTLVRPDKTLAPETIAAARRLVDTGVAMSLISARPPCGIAWIADALDLPGPFGAFNGGTIFGRDGTVLDRCGIEPGVAAEMVALFQTAGVTLWVFADGKWYSSTADDPHIPREIKSANLDPIITSDFSGLLDRIDKIVAVSDDAVRLTSLENIAVALADGAATVSRSQRYYLDVTARGADKGVGISRIAEAFGVALEDVAVIGDQANDLPMFDRAGLSIAMGQSDDAVKARADWSTASNVEDGVAQAIDRLLAAK